MCLLLIWLFMVPFGLRLGVDLCNVHLIYSNFICHHSLCVAQISKDNLFHCNEDYAEMDVGFQ